MSDTSRLAYQQIKPKLGELQATCLIIIHGTPDQTDREYAELASMHDPADFRRRRGELVTKKLVKCSGKRVCTVTGKLSHTWRTTQ
jgi:hypothetical protein